MQATKQYMRRLFFMNVQIYRYVCVFVRYSPKCNQNTTFGGEKNAKTKLSCMKLNASNFQVLKRNYFCTIIKFKLKTPIGVFTKTVRALCCFKLCS